jgi:hypothetical protein
LNATSQLFFFSYFSLATLSRSDWTRNFWIWHSWPWVSRTLSSESYSRSQAPIWKAIFCYAISFKRSWGWFSLSSGQTKQIPCSTRSIVFVSNISFIFFLLDKIIMLYYLFFLAKSFRSVSCRSDVTDVHSQLWD